MLAPPGAVPTAAALMDDGAPLLGAATSEHYKRHIEFEKWRAAVYWFSLIFLVRAAAVSFGPARSSRLTAVL